MSVKLLAEHHLECLSLKGGCTGTSQIATLLEISCRGSELEATVVSEGEIQ